MRETESKMPTRSATMLGRTLRNVLVAPSDGFAGAIAAAERRARAGDSLPEGRAPYVLAALGGAALMIAWLKIGGLLGGRDVDPGEFGLAELGLALFVGAVLALLGQGVWGVAAPWLARSLKGDLSARNARIVWGTAAWPQVLIVALLLPLDLVIVGPHIFATSRPGDSLATGWASISVAVCVLVAMWSLSLFVRGVQVVARLDLVRSIGAVVGAGACISLVTAAGSLTLLLVWG